MKQAKTIEDKAARIAECFNSGELEFAWRAYRKAIEGRTVTRIIGVTLAVLDRLDRIGHDADHVEIVEAAGFRAIAQAYRKRRDDLSEASKKKGARHEG